MSVVPPIATKLRTSPEVRFCQQATWKVARLVTTRTCLPFLKPAKLPRYKPASSGYSRAVVSSLSELAPLLARQTAAEPITWSRA